MKSVRRIRMEKKESRLLHNPALIIVGSFLISILIGGGILTLPIFNRQGVFMPFIDALFTATSATCVTGLVVYDTYLYFNMAGQIVVILLIQLGGLGVVTLTSFAYLLVGKRVGLRTAHLAQESVSSDEQANTANLVRTVVFFTAVVELIGALLLSIYFVPPMDNMGRLFPCFWQYLLFAMQVSICWE